MWRRFAGSANCVLRISTGGKSSLGASGAERFVEVKLATAAPTLGADEDRRVEVVLRNGRSLRVGRGFDPELVRALAAVLESAA